VSKKNNEKKVKWVDTHCHIQHTDLTIEKLDLSNIEWLLIPGVNVESSEQASAISSSFPSLCYWAAGLHPHEASTIELYKKNLTDLFDQCDAIGETGLDYYRNLSDRKSQLESFEFHVDAAIRKEKPLIVHCRDSFEDVHTVIEGNTFTAPVILHSWTGGRKWTKKFLNLNVYFSFSGIVTYDNARDLQLACKDIPLENILLETDTPYLVPNEIEAKINQPIYIENTAKKVAAIKDVDLIRLSNITIENSNKCFIERKFPHE
tara:strand:+ start:3757 stop:4542 length:786 start_codon:yes stop_codon:yes gene_type:complete